MQLSFVLDIADLYKTAIGIPVAFDVAAEDDQDLGARTRRALRDRIKRTSLPDRCVDDIKALLLPDVAIKGTAADPDTDRVVLQSDGGRQVPAGRNYADRRPGHRRGVLVTVIVLANCPPGLRGFLTRWLLEISVGVFIGNPSARVRDALWDEVRQYAGQGRSLLAHTTNNADRKREDPGMRGGPAPVCPREHGHHRRPSRVARRSRSS